jgi:sigma-B regulation protein RsbU (phosphoserine phosphatase)
VLVPADGPPRLVGEPGDLLGVMEAPQASAAVLELRPGDRLLLYTDGVTDASGSHGRFEVERLVELLERLGDAGADEIVGTIDAALGEFQVGPQRDDVALLALEVD